MTPHDLREMDQERLATHLRTLRVDYVTVLEGVRSGKEKNHAQLKGLKRAIAQVQTIIREKLHSN